MSLSGHGKLVDTSKYFVVVIGLTSALDAPRLHPFGQGRGPSHRWCTHPISVLCRHFWHDHQILDLALDGQVLVSGFLRPAPIRC